MAGSSPGASGSTSFTVSEAPIGGTGEACPWPCNRGCVPLECIVKLPKSVDISVLGSTVEGREYVTVSYRVSFFGLKKEAWELSVDNFTRTISTCHEVEEVTIRDERGSFDGGEETWKAVCESVKTVPSLKKLGVVLMSSPCLVSDAEVIFSVLGAAYTVQECIVQLCNEESSEDVIVRVLVSALVRNQALQKLELHVKGGKGGIAEVSMYMRARPNVLTSLWAEGLSDEEVVQVAEALDGNEQLRQLIIKRDGNGSGGGVGRIGEALRTNHVLKELRISDTEVGGEEMEALVGALVPPDLPLSCSRYKTQLHTLGFTYKSIRNKEGMEQVATLLRSNCYLRCLVLSGVDILQEGHEDLMAAAQMLFTALKSNEFLEYLDLGFCGGIGGKEVLEMIMDMLSDNEFLRDIELKRTGLGRDGGAKVVYDELDVRKQKAQERPNLAQDWDFLLPSQFDLMTLRHIEVAGLIEQFEQFEQPLLECDKKTGLKGSKKKVRKIKKSWHVESKSTK